MDDTLTRFWTDLIGRATGPMTFRFILQPLMGAYYAYRDGKNDALAGRPPYLRTIVESPGARGDLLHQGWNAMGRVIALGVIMDVIYQIIVFRAIYPLELVAIVLLLAFVPYLLLRGPFNRMVRRRIRT